MEQKLIASSLSYCIHGKCLINNINLEFDAGCLHGILGPNGSGKSTLLKTMAGIWQPTLGRVVWNGEPLLEKDRREISQIISLVPQSQQPAFDFLVEDLVAMGRYPYHPHYWTAMNNPHIQDALMLVDAWHLRQRQVNQLSYGERQRVYIARALVTESPILLLDEPTASLDIQHQFAIWQMLGKLVEQNKIVIVTTHDLAIAERFCQRVAILNRGKCVGSGEFSSVMTSPLLQEVFGVMEVETHRLPYKQYTLY